MIQEKILDELSLEIIEGKIKEGGTVVVENENNQIVMKAKTERKKK